MVISQIGNNTITACTNPECDQVISVKGEGGRGIDLLDRAMELHLVENPKCQQYLDSLPSLDELLQGLHDHKCVTGNCNCICGCTEPTGCQLVFGSTLCTSCQVDNVRGGDCEPKPEPVAV